MLILSNTVIEEKELNERHRYPEYGESIFSAVSAGFFFVLIGAIFVYATFIQGIDLIGDIIAFFRDFDIVIVPHTRRILLPAPGHPSEHLSVYSAALQFSLVWGLYQIGVLALRFVTRSPLNRKAETTSNIAFWLGASYLVSIFLNKTALSANAKEMWFVFWSVVIMLIGLSLVVRAIILAVARLL